MKTNILLLFSVCLLVCSCAKKATPETAHIRILSPITMQAQSHTVVLQDYFLEPLTIDSVAVSKGFTIQLKNDGTKAEIEAISDSIYIGNLRVWQAKNVTDIPVFASESKTVSIQIPQKNYKEVLVKGEFSNWQLQPLKLANAQWTYTTTVPPGNHQYVLVIDGVEMPDPTNDATTPNGFGGTNSLLQVPTYKTERPFIQTHKVTANGLVLEIENQCTQLKIYHGNTLLPVSAISRQDNNVQVTVPLDAYTRNALRVFGANKFGRANDVYIPLNLGKPIEEASQLSRTDFHSQIMYFLMVDRFKDGNPSNTRKVANDSIHPKANYYGGDLEGVLQTLESDYFTELGVNTIWLSPITQNPEGAYGLWPEPLTKFSGYHGYWPISNTKIDDRFGTDSVFETLIETAHQKGINVLLDYVANHVHEAHPLYKEHPDWATNLYLPDGSLNTEKWDEHRLTTWFDTFMPTLDFSKPEVVEALTDSAMYWVTRYKLDGFRHDATKHIQLAFWRTLTQKIKANTKRPVFQIGETYGSPALISSYINSGMLDAQFDFNLYDTAVQAFANQAGFTRLATQLEQALTYYGHHHLMGNITGNQDRARFISYASGDVRFDEDAKKAGWTRTIGMSDTTAYKKLAQLHAFNLSIPGIPCIYYGDEYGSIGGNDPDNRKQMQFENLNAHEAKLRDEVKALVNFRRQSMALQYGSTKIITADNTRFIIKRQYFNQVVYLVINTSNTAFTFQENTIAPNSYQFISL